jgi:hypothetical protein
MVARAYGRRGAGFSSGGIAFGSGGEGAGCESSLLVNYALSGRLAFFVGYRFTMFVANQIMFAGRSARRRMR